MQSLYLDDDLELVTSFVPFIILKPLLVHSSCQSKDEALIIDCAFRGVCIFEGLECSLVLSYG